MSDLGQKLLLLALKVTQMAIWSHCSDHMINDLQNRDVFILKTDGTHTYVAYQVLTVNQQSN